MAAPAPDVLRHGRYHADLQCQFFGRQPRRKRAALCRPRRQTTRPIRATSALGNPQLGSRNIVVNNGAVLQFTAGNVLGSGTAQSNTVVTPLVINAGGLVANTSGAGNILGNVVLNGGTLDRRRRARTARSITWQLSSGSVTANTAPSVMTGSGANTGFNMAQNTTFNVAATGGASPDLTVSATLGDVQYGLASASLTKTGNGSMLLSANNTYTGNTTVSGGTLALAGAARNNIATSPTITLGAGGVLDVSGLSGGVWPWGRRKPSPASGPSTAA